jgi:CO/xanthine dehydrogenase FAD-binding subunit
LRMRDADEDVEFNAEEFFIGPMLTMIPPTACLFEICFRKSTSAYVGTGFHEIAARRSDYALAAAAAHIEADDTGIVQDLRLAIGGISDFPQRLPIDVHIDISAGKTNLDSNLTTAIDAALDGIDVVEDMHASASYRRRVAAELARRAVDDALSEIAQDLS